MAEEATEGKVEEKEKPSEKAETSEEESDTVGKPNEKSAPADSGKITMNQMYSLYLEPSFNKLISQEGRKWLARAMINMLLADKTIDPSELSYISDAMSLVETEEERNELMEATKNRDYLEMDILHTDREYAGYFFFYLAMIIAADGRVKTSEVNFLAKMCGKLGFPSDFAKDVLHWTTKLVKLNTEREQMIDVLSRINPIFSKN